MRPASPASGLVTTLERLANQNLFTSRDADPYLQTHPLPRDRMIALEQLVSASKYFDMNDPADLQLRHDLVRAKLVGFTWTSGRVLTALSAAATRACRRGTPGRSRPTASAACRRRMKQIDGLIAGEPRRRLLLGAEGPGAAGDRQPEAGARSAAQGGVAGAEGRADQGAAWPGAGRDRQQVAGQGGDQGAHAGLQDDPTMPRGLSRAGARLRARAATSRWRSSPRRRGCLPTENEGRQASSERVLKQNLKRGSPAWLRADDIVAYNPPKVR